MTPKTTTAPRSSLLTIALMAIVLGFLAVNLVKSLHCGQGALCIDDYWARLWTLSYSDGYLRRALLGSVMRGLLGDTYGAWLLNAVCLAGAMLALGLIVFLTGRKPGPMRRLCMLALCVGPPLTLLLETLGDPMQFVVLAMAACALLRGMPGGVVAILLIPVAMLAHEGSVFLHVPVLLILAFHFFGRSPRILFLGLTIVGLALGALGLSEPDGLTSTGRIVTVDGQFLTGTGELLPGLWELFLIEMQIHFGSATGPFVMVRNLLGAVVWPILFLCVLSVSLQSARPLVLYLTLLALSLPLYLVAHDWGRFQIHTMFGAIVLTAAGAEIRFAPMFGGLEERLRLGLGHLRPYMTPEVCIVALLTYEAHRYYRVEGLTIENMAILALLLAVLTLGRRYLSQRDT